jgi:hypothetical protein
MPTRPAIFRKWHRAVLFFFRHGQTIRAVKKLSKKPPKEGGQLSNAREGATPDYFWSAASEESG